MCPQLLFDASCETDENQIISGALGGLARSQWTSRYHMLFANLYLHSLSSSMRQGKECYCPITQSSSRFFATPWIAAHQASLSITNSWSLLKLRPIELVMPSNHLILCRPLLLLPSIFPIIRVFSNESALCIRWPKNWSFSFNIRSSNENPGLISFRMDRLDLLGVQGTLKHLL